MSSSKCTDRNLNGIAIIGMAGQFPGAPSISELSRHLRDGVDLISRFQAGRDVVDGSTYVGARGQLDGIEFFDHLYFDISPSEAALIDPQQRMFLQNAVHALECGGYDPDRYDGSIGVYAGVSNNSYLINNIYKSLPNPTTAEQFNIMVANDKDYISTRVSHKLNLRGPSYTIQTACSTSLVAIHHACLGLLTGECDMALAGAATVRVPQSVGYHFESGLVFSKSGYVRPFDDAADGTVMSNGVGVLLLKRLADAIDDGDTVHAIIRGSATNNDGATKASFAAPSRAGQANVIREALAVAEVSARSISYVEAHGTGTRLGDPVEVAALTEAYRADTVDNGYCAIGSAKSNFGHLDSAAGVAGLIKIVEMMKQKMLFPTINFNKPNKAIAFEQTPFFVCDTLRPWLPEALPRRAGISSFGVGGTNAHVVLEEAPEICASRAEQSIQILPISGKTQEALHEMSRDMAEWLDCEKGHDLADVGYSLAVGRRVHSKRMVVVCETPDMAKNAFLAFDPPADKAGVLDEQLPWILLIPDDIGEFLPYAQLLEEHEPRFIRHLHRCQEALDLQFGSPFFTDAQTGSAPALRQFVFQFCATNMLLDLGVVVERFVGDGLGELVLGCILGAVDLPAGLTAILSSDGSYRDLAEKLVQGKFILPRDGWHSLGHERTLPAGFELDYDYWIAVLGRSSAHDFNEMRNNLLVIGEKSAGLSSATHQRQVVCLTEEWQADNRSLAFLVADLWQRGCGIDWRKFYAGQKRRRISLPNYPFARIRHWIEPPQMPVKSGLGDGSRDVPESVRQPLVLQRAWSDMPLHGDKRDLRRVVIVHGPDTLVLAQKLAGRVPNAQIVNEINLHREAVDVAGLDAWIDLVGYGFEETRSTDFLGIMQKVVSDIVPDASRPKPVFLGVTRYLEACVGEPVNLTGALRAPLFRILRQEHPWMESRHCDLGDGTIEAAAAALELEVSVVNSEDWVRYRGGVRQSVKYEPTAPSDLVSGEGRSEAIDPNDVVMITGGTRGVGMLVAKHLAKKYGVRRMALGYREMLPERSEWASQGLADAVKAKIHDLQLLEEMGVSVHLFSVNTTDEASLKLEIDAISKSLGSPTVVIHTAGRADLRNVKFLSKSRADFDSVLAPKIGLVDSLFQSLDLSALRLAVLFSSAAAAVSGLAAGQSDYAIANAYLDYVAQAKTLPGSRVVSIEWPSWKETGMGEAKSISYQKTGLLSMTDSEGLTLLDTVLRNPGQPIMLPAIVDGKISNADALLMPEPGQRMASFAPVDENSRSTVNQPSSGQSPSLASRAVQIVARSLGMHVSEIDASVPLHRYGADSIQLASIARQFNVAMSCNMDVATLLQYPTVSELVGWIAQTYPENETASVGDGQVYEGSQPKAFREAAPSNRVGEHVRDQQIAVIGMSCRFPGANGIDEFKRMLDHGESAIGPIPQDRWGRQTPYFAGLIDDVGCFDAEFFGIPPEDVAAMDPQALLLLEETLSAIYHAGYDQKDVQGMPIGVFVGGRSTHNPNQKALSRARNPIVAISPNYLASNLSYFFDLRGPSLVVDTACSSALVAMELAVNALRAGTIDTAIVAGVSVLESSTVHDIFAQRRLLNAGSDFFVMDQRGKGVTPGEGVGVVILKSMERAVADHDQIYAVIEGLAINNDGRTNGPAMPSFAMQKAVMEQALKQAKELPENISYIDLSASGSEVSDLLELRAVEAVYRSGNRKSCQLGSVKPNIGHTLAAHGMASFIKTTLMLHHASVPPSLSGQQGFEHFPLEQSCFRFPSSRTNWQGQKAAISVFADGGTNAHVILAAGPQLNKIDGGGIEH